MPAGRLLPALQVWVTAQLEGGKLHWRADSDSQLTKVRACWQHPHRTIRRAWPSLLALGWPAQLAWHPRSRLVHAQNTLRLGVTLSASAPLCPSCLFCLQGLAALLVQGLSGCTPAEIVGVPADFITQLGLQQSLTPSRNNGFLNMFRLMQKKALDIFMQQQQQQQQQQGGSGSAVDSPSSSEEEGTAAIEQQDSSSSSDEAAAEAARFSAAAALASNTPVADSMRRKLAEELQPLKLDLVDNSHQHAGHSGGCPQDVLYTCGGCSTAAQSCIWQSCTAAYRTAMEGCLDSCPPGYHQQLPLRLDPPAFAPFLRCCRPPRQRHLQRRDPLQP